MVLKGMKKELFVHFAFMVSLFIFISLFRRYFSLYHLLFWVGGILGTVLPDIDHLLYVYLSNPADLIFGRFTYFIKEKKFAEMLGFLSQIQYERERMVFHTATFQLIFVVLAFLVVTSSGSILGRGLVLAFLLHLAVDQLSDLMRVGSLNNWFGNFPLSVSLDKEKATFYWLGNLIVLVVLGFIF